MAIKCLVMDDCITSWPMVKAIPDKEATTVANVIFEKLIFAHGSPEILLSDNGQEFTNDTLAYVCQEFGIEQHFTSLILPGQMARQGILISSSGLNKKIVTRRQSFMGSSS